MLDCYAKFPVYIISAHKVVDVETAKNHINVFPVLFFVFLMCSRVAPLSREGFGPKQKSLVKKSSSTTGCSSLMSLNHRNLMLSGTLKSTSICRNVFCMFFVQNNWIESKSQNNVRHERQKWRANMQAIIERIFVSTRLCKLIVHDSEFDSFCVPSDVRMTHHPASAVHAP